MTKLKEKAHDTEAENKLLKIQIETYKDMIKDLLKWGNANEACFEVRWREISWDSPLPALYSRCFDSHREEFWLKSLFVTIKSHNSIELYRKEDKKMVTVHLHTTDPLHDGAIDVDTLFASAAQRNHQQSPLQTTVRWLWLNWKDWRQRNTASNMVSALRAYIGNSDNGGREHLVLLAKNFEGYKAISKAVTLSIKNIVEWFPIMTTETLASCFGPFKYRSRHVIATSACMAGVVMKQAYTQICK